MATIRPFMGIRPAPEYAKDVAALPYDVMNTEEAREMVKGNPYSFLHIDRAEIDLPVGTDPYSPAVYEKARDTFYEQLDKGIFTQDLLPNLYIYRLTMDGRSQTGLVVCTAIDEYLNDTIKKHELTRADKEADRIRHVDTLNANTGPIFLAYKENAPTPKPSSTAIQRRYLLCMTLFPKTALDIRYGSLTAIQKSACWYRALPMWKISILPTDITGTHLL